jgi:hypothetical protein
LIQYLASSYSSFEHALRIFYRRALQDIEPLVGDLVWYILASGLLEHVSCAVGLRSELVTFLLTIFINTYNLLVHATVLLSVLSHSAAELLLGSIEALVDVVLVACVLVSGVGVHDEGW